MVPPLARRALGFALALGLLAIASPAHAAPHRNPAAEVARRLAAGQKLFDDQEYARAVTALVPVTRDPAATRADRVRAWELIALARFILGDRAGARDAFERVLEIDPGFELRDDTGSPRIRAFFDEVRGAAGDVDLEHAAPRAAVAGGKAELEVRALRGAAAVVEVVVMHRQVGALAYDTASARPVGDARWRGAISLPPSRRGYAVEYYIEARGAGGAVVGRIASPDAPLSLEITPGGGRERRHWYARWYSIAGAAAITAGTAGAIVWATRGPSDGSLPPGRVKLDH